MELQAVVGFVLVLFERLAMDHVGSDLVVNHLALSLLVALVLVYHFGLVVLVPDFGLVVLMVGLVALSAVGLGSAEQFLQPFLVLYFQIVLVYFLLPSYLSVY